MISLNLLKYLNLIGFIVTVFVNYLANALPLNGKNTGQISDGIPNLFTPAGYVFTIWGLIYLQMMIFIIFQFVGDSSQKNQAIERIGIFFFISCIANSLWIFAWHFERINFSLFFTLSILLSLSVAQTQLSNSIFSSYSVNLIIKPFFSVYLGWASVATIANVSAVLVVGKWKLPFGLGEDYWCCLTILSGVCLSVVNNVVKGDVLFSLVFIWALFGIIIKRYYTLPFHKNIVITSFLGIIIIFFSFFMKKMKN